MPEKHTTPPELLRMAEEYALQYLGIGRASFDVPHTRRVVHYAQELARAVKQDVSVLSTAAWLHDTGYSGIFEGDSHEYDQIKNRKQLHMEIGAQLARVFVDLPDVRRLLALEQRDRVVHLVGVHDALEELRDLDEIVLMEADTLGALDVSHVTPTFDYENAMKYLEGLRTRRVPVFQTELGKSYLGKLLAEFEAYYEGGHHV